jgi:colanic acid biosynthesis glycosyl transferase WcaI
MQRRVLLIGGNFYPEPIGIGKYNGEMIDWLAENGYDCTVVTSFPYYPQWKVQQPYVKKSNWYTKEVKYYKPFYENKVSIYRCPQYVPDMPTGSKRMLNGFSFFISSFLVVFKLLFSKKFDYVISVVPSFETGLLAILYKGIKGGKFLYHIQDLQIDAARDLKILKSKSLINILLKVEKFILNKADVVSTVSSGMMDKVKIKCEKNVRFFPNWVDNKVIYQIADKSALKEEFNFDSTDKIILYSGAIGEKQGLEIIMYVAEYFIKDQNIKFVICGSGPYLKQLLELKNKLNVENVIFISTQPVEKLNHFLNMADLHLIVQKANATDLVMPSKLTNILATGGVSIVTALPGSSLHELIIGHNVGLLAIPEDVMSLTSVIRKAIDSDKSEISRNAVEYAERHFSISNIISKYYHQMEEVPEEKQIESIAFQVGSHFSPLEVKL